MFKLPTCVTIEKLNINHFTITSNIINVIASNKQSSNYLVMPTTCCVINLWPFYLFPVFKS
jgi:hypothetical protein